MTTINIPVTLDASLTENGITIHAWTEASDDLAGYPISMEKMIDELIEAYYIPNQLGKTVMSRSNWAYLCDILDMLQDTSNYLVAKLDGVQTV